MEDKYKDIGEPQDCLIEECAEVIKEICKAMRFGWHNWHPEDKGKTKNYVRVLKEISHLEHRIYEFKRWIKIHSE